MSESGIEVVLEVIFPTATGPTGDFTGLPGMEDEVERIKNAGSKIIVNFATYNSMHFVLHEAMRYVCTYVRQLSNIMNRNTGNTYV